MAYAKDTAVPVERTRAEIEKLLRKHGADRFSTGWDSDKAFVSFWASGRYVRFVLPLPRQGEEEFIYRPGRASYSKPIRRSNDAALRLWQQVCRSRWRALLLSIKAKLESIAAEIETFEQAFLAHIVLPDQTLVGDRIIGAVTQAYQTGIMPALPSTSTIDVEENE